MAKTAMIRARIEPRLKTSAEGLLAQMGLSPTDAITMFYTQIELRRGLPFAVRLPTLTTGHNWLDEGASAPYPLAGTDAQTWINNEREASDRDRVIS